MVYEPDSWHPYCGGTRAVVIAYTTEGGRSVDLRPKRQRRSSLTWYVLQVQYWVDGNITFRQGEWRGSYLVGFTSPYLPGTEENNDDNTDNNDTNGTDNRSSGSANDAFNSTLIYIVAGTLPWLHGVYC